MKHKAQLQKGTGMVEIIICLAITIIAFWGLLELARYNLRVQAQSKAKIESLNLAAEAMEAVRSARDEDWNNLAGLSFGTKYYPVISGNKWILDLTSPGPINGIYERWTIVERVYRDGSDNISSSGAEDVKTRKITATVQWIDHNKTKQTQLTTYLTNWQE